jgi:hypothetical protein
MNHSPSRILLLVENLLAKGVSVQLVHDNSDTDASGYVVLSTEDGTSERLGSHECLSSWPSVVVSRNVIRP